MSALSRLGSAIRILKRSNSLFERYLPYSTQTAVLTDEKLQRFRTHENNPVHHSELHIGKFYTMPSKLKQSLFHSGGIPKSLDNLISSFLECSILVRQPFLEISSYLKTANYDFPALRIVLYGALGVGKTVTLMHLVHYAHVQKYLILHVPWVSSWTKRPKELVESQSRPGRLDLPVESTLWLQHFKAQNYELLKELDLKTSKGYTWSQREATEEGMPLLDVVEHGLTRGVHASDCIAVLLSEIKLQSESGRFKTLVVIDGVNAFYAKTNLRMPDRTQAKATRLTMVHAFQKMMKNDWKNAAVVVSVDTIIQDREFCGKIPFTPKSLLGTEGFEVLDPFIPIEVVKYSEKEIESVLDYYIDRMWIQHEEARTEEGRMQLKFLSGLNPYTLMKICDPL